MNELAKIITSELCELLERSGVRCIIKDGILANRTVIYIAADTRYTLHAIIIFDFPFVQLTTMKSYLEYRHTIWRRTGEYNYDLADPHSIDWICDAINNHCNTLVTV